VILVAQEACDEEFLVAGGTGGFRLFRLFRSSGGFRHARCPTFAKQPPISSG
jgi:hypothetical protein